MSISPSSALPPTSSAAPTNPTTSPTTTRTGCRRPRKHAVDRGDPQRDRARSRGRPCPTGWCARPRRCRRCRRTSGAPPRSRPRATGSRPGGRPRGRRTAARSGSSRPPAIEEPDAGREQRRERLVRPPRSRRTWCSRRRTRCRERRPDAGGGSSGPADLVRRGPAHDPHDTAAGVRRHCRSRSLSVTDASAAEPSILLERLVAGATDASDSLSARHARGVSSPSSGWSATSSSRPRRRCSAGVATRSGRRSEHERVPGLSRAAGVAPGAEREGDRVDRADRAGARVRDRARLPVPPEELLLPGHAEELPDQPVRPSRVRRRPARDRGRRLAVADRHHARAHGGGHRQDDTRGGVRADRAGRPRARRLQPRGRPARRGRLRARPAHRRSRRARTSTSSAPPSRRSTSRTSGWRRVRSGATRTSRRGGPARTPWARRSRSRT